MNCKYYASTFLVLIMYSIGYGQGYISPSGVMISHAHAKGGLMFTYSYMDMHMNDNWSGSEKVSDAQIWNDYLYAPQNMYMGMHMLMGMYGLSNRFSLMMMTEYKTSSMTMSLIGSNPHHHHGDSTQMADSNIHEHNAAGFGDTKLWAVYKLTQTDNSSIVVSAGVNIPTGRINIEVGEHALHPGERQPYMMQTGTGTVDLMPGLTYLSIARNFTWSIQALSTLRFFNNTAGYHYGSEITLNAWAAHQFTSFLSASIRLEGYSGGTISGFDPQIYAVTQPGADPDCYGGERLSAYGGVNFYLNGGWFQNSKIALELGAPLYQHVNGIQQVPLLQWNASITKAF